MKMLKKPWYPTKPDDFEKSYVDFDHIKKNTSGATSELFFAEKIIKNAPRSSENGDAQTYRYRGGGPYEWTEIPFENPARASLGDSCIYLKKSKNRNIVQIWNPRISEEGVQN